METDELKKSIKQKQPPASKIRQEYCCHPLGQQKLSGERDSALEHLPKADNRNFFFFFFFFRLQLHLCMWLQVLQECAARFP
jgi:hypothetical protein